MSEKMFKNCPKIVQKVIKIFFKFVQKSIEDEEYLLITYILETICCKKQQKKSRWTVTGLWNRGPLKILNGIKLIPDDQRNHLDSYTISLKSFRSFRVPLFNKPVTAQELFLLFLTDWNRVFPYHVYVIFLFFFSSLQTNTICDTIYTKECSFSNKTTCTTSYENECKTTTENKCTIVYDEKCSAVYEDKCQTGKISALTFKFVLKVK